MDASSLLEMARAVRKAFDLWSSRDKPQARAELKEAGVSFKGIHSGDPADTYSKITGRAHADEV
jgi:hypothetical protein